MKRTRSRKTSRVVAPRSITVEVEMGQAFRDALPNAIKNLGGRVWSKSFDYGETVVRVRATFRNGWRSGDIQRALWDKWPMCSIGVKEV